MTQSIQFATQQSAKEYLVNLIMEQAKFESTPLSETEAKMLYYSVEEPSVADEIADQFPDDDTEYEKKIVGIVERCIKREYDLGDQEIPEIIADAINKLNEGDHFLSIIASQGLFNFTMKQPAEDIPPRSRPIFDKIVLYSLLGILGLILIVFLIGVASIK